MAKQKKINTSTLLNKIQKITQEKMTSESVISLDRYRAFKKNLKPPTLLIIEDDETVRTALRRVLESDGYRVLAASDGTQLNTVLNGDKIDLILLDVGLPWINGFELAKLLKEHVELEKTPLVFISGKTDVQDVREGFAVG